MVELKRHEEETVVSRFPASFGLKFVSPQIALVGPVANVPLFSPRVLHLKKTLAVAQSQNGDDVVSVTLNNAVLVGSSVAATGGTSHKDITSFVVGANPVPESITADLIVGGKIVWIAGHGAHTPAGVATDDVLVVALVFCKGFFKNRDPEGGVRADACKNGL
jgi:hypothetical protein